MQENILTVWHDIMFSPSLIFFFSMHVIIYSLVIYVEKGALNY